MSYDGSPKPNGHAKADEPLKNILERFDTELPVTLRDAYRANPEHSWGEFISAVNQLISKGFLAGKGDGFVVHYFLTNEGRTALGRSG